MVLRVFIKRKAHGELCTDDYEFSEQFIEAPEILKAEAESPLKNKVFKFSLKNSDGSQIPAAYCDTQTHGYEIKDSNGNVIDRYVTKIND